MCNAALHNADQAQESTYTSLEAAEIRHFFHQPHLLSAHDRHYCTGSILQLLRQRPSHRRRWLLRVRRVKDEHRQARITWFFARRPSTRSTPLSPAQRTKNVSTPPFVSLQGGIPTPRHGKAHPIPTMITHYFPGRPPDIHDEIPPPITTKSPAS